MKKYYIESAKDLSDFERKLLTIIQHHNRRGGPTSLRELEIRTGRKGNEIKEVIKVLIKRGWLKVIEGELTVTRILF